MPEKGRPDPTENASYEMPPCVRGAWIAFRSMFTWQTGIGKILGDHLRAQAALDERAARERSELSDFCAMAVLPALENLRRECEAYGRSVEVRREGHFISLTVLVGGKVEFRYAILASRNPGKRNRSRYRDSLGYGRDVDRVYSLREARRLGPGDVARDTVAAYRRALANSR